MYRPAKSVAEEGLVRTEQLLGAVAALVDAERAGGVHLLGRDYREVAAQLHLAPEHVALQLPEEKLLSVIGQVSIP